MGHWAWLPSKSPAELLSEAATGAGKAKTCNQAGLYKDILRQQVLAMQDPAIRQDLIAGPYCRACNKYFLRQLVQAGQGPALSFTSAFQPSLSPHLLFSLSIIAKDRPKGVTAFSYKIAYRGLLGCQHFGLNCEKFFLGLVMVFYLILVIF